MIQFSAQNLLETFDGFLDGDKFSGMTSEYFSDLSINKFQLINIIQTLNF